jgi:hypothetical protein
MPLDNVRLRRANLWASIHRHADQFETAFNGNLNQDGTEIAGEFEQGPSGKPVKVTFKSFKPSDIPEPEKVYTFAAGEPWDIRGYWKATLEAMPGMSLRVGLKISRLPDRTFSAAMDVFDHGALTFRQLLSASQIQRASWNGNPSRSCSTPN